MANISNHANVLKSLAYNETFKTKTKSLKISFNGITKTIPLEDIIHLKACSSYTQFFIKGYSIPFLKSKPLKYYQQQLNNDQFIRVHKSHLVNRNFIQSFHLNSKRLLLLKDGSEICISRRKLAELKNKFK